MHTSSLLSLAALAGWVLALAPADLPLVLAQRDLASDAGTAREATAALAQHANKALHEGGPCAAPCVDWFQSAQTCSGDGVDGQTAATQCACDPTFVGGSTICAWCIGFEALNEARRLVGLCKTIQDSGGLTSRFSGHPTPSMPSWLTATPSSSPAIGTVSNDVGATATAIALAANVSGESAASKTLSGGACAAAGAIVAALLR